MKKPNTDHIMTDHSMWPKFIVIESKAQRGNTLAKLIPFTVSKYVENFIGNMGAAVV